ncbi:MAG: methyl-accepting chemotaxis protein [Proteobacteria bacterium]|nr:methyl-accepting chemotaxis protein [Pseudomonadota bacterium]
MLMRFWWAVLAFFYPDPAIAEDAQLNRQVRLAISFCLIAPIFLYANAVKWIRFEAYHIALAGAVLASLLLLMSFLYKFKILPLGFISNFIIFSLFLDLYYLTFFSGGVNSQQIFWVLLIPLFAYLLLPIRWGHGWFAITFVAVAVLFILESQGYPFPDVKGMSKQDEFVQWTMAIFGCLFSIYVTAMLFKAGHLSSVSQMEESKEKAETMSQNLANVLNQIKESSDSLSVSSTGLLETSKQLEEDTSMYFDKTSSIYDSSQSIRRKMDTVAAEIKLATSRMDDISKTAMKARKIAEDGNSIAKETSESMANLKKGGEDSANITNMIQQTSKQLKLLSLNAAIEAANAGEHGEGFAIVANQVKNLAERTSEATAEVTEINKNIQITTDRSAEYIASIVDIIQDFYSLQQTISTAVEKQDEATRVISKGLSETAEIASAISDSVNEVVSATERTQEEVQKNFTEATGLASMSKSLIQLLKSEGSR